MAKPTFREALESSLSADFRSLVGEKEYERILARSEALARLQKDSDRSAGIVSAALVEEELELAIRRHFVAANSELRKRADWLFQPASPLGSFSAKIDFGALIGIYGKEAYADLVRIKDIRNKFAHKIELHSFDQPEIKVIANAMTYCTDKLIQKDGHLYFPFPHGGGFGYPRDFNPRDTPRHVFTFSCGIFINLLPNAAINGRHHDPIF